MGRHTSLEMKIWFDRSNKILSRRGQEQQQNQEYLQQQEIQEKMNEIETCNDQKIPQNIEFSSLPLKLQETFEPVSLTNEMTEQIQPIQSFEVLNEKHIKPISIKQIKLRQQRDQLLKQSKNFFEQVESDFESDSENALDATFENSQRTFNFLLFDSFIQQKEANLQQLKNLAELRKFDLVTFLNNQLREQNKKKEFQCQYCSKSFDKASALGGHTSKNHPSKSKSYQKRIFSSCIRKIERKRSSFLKKKLKS